MAAYQRPLHEGEPRLVPSPKHGVDRQALRDMISQRYEHTLRRLGQ